MTFIEPTAGRGALDDWSSIDWPAVERNVRRLQERIFRASQNGEHAQVKNLQRLLVRSSSAKLLAIRRVTQINRGKRTPGIDGVVCTGPSSRLAMFRKGLNLRGYRPKPVRRVYIPKAGGKQRPLGIPTMLDRVMQALVTLALEPEWEPRFEANSYGFRPGRCTMDAIEAIYRALSQNGSSRWVLDADIAKCFDQIDHAALLGRLPVFTTTIRRWLKAGVVELGALNTTTMGTPQGGIISPLLANIALDGMERLFGAERSDGRQIVPCMRERKRSGHQPHPVCRRLRGHRPIQGGARGRLRGTGRNRCEAKRGYLWLRTTFHFMDSAAHGLPSPVSLRPALPSPGTGRNGYASSEHLASRPARTASRPMRTGMSTLPE